MADPPSGGRFRAGQGNPGDLDAESSAELVRRAQGGDRNALDRLCRRHLEPLRRWAHGRLPAYAREIIDTDDLVQETLVNTVQQIGGFEPRRDGALQAYLRKAVHNRIVQEVRRAHRAPPAASLGEQNRDPSASPLEQAIGGEMLERYEAALERLRDDDREAIITRIEQGMSYQEVARAIDKPTPAAARMAVARALVRLADEMGHER